MPVPNVLQRHSRRLFNMPGLTVSIDLATGKLQVNCWIMAADLVKLGYKFALAFLRWMWGNHNNLLSKPPCLR